MLCSWKETEYADIAGKVVSAQRLTVEDGLRLLRCRDLAFLGHLADLVRKRLSGDMVYFSTYLNMNYTNVCQTGCPLCVFYRSADDSGACTWSVDEIIHRVKKALEHDSIHEVHIVGGLNKNLPFSYYLDVLRAIKQVREDLFVKAFTAVEIDFLARLENRPAEEILQELQRAGLDSLPGGGAEIFSPRVRRQICPLKISAKRWLEIHRMAHQMGLPTNATMLYGHIETDEEIMDHLARLRDLQDETHGFQSFVPLPFLSERAVFQPVRRADGWTTLRLFAVSRLFLDSIPHLKAYWTALGVKLAQVALHFGVDDLSGTALEERILHEAGARTPVSLERKDLIELIQQSGRKAQEVTSAYAT